MASWIKSTATESLVALYNLGGREASLKDVENIFNQDGSNREFSEGSYAGLMREYAAIRLKDISDYDAAGCIVGTEINLVCSSAVHRQKTDEEKEKEGNLSRTIEETIWNGGDKLVERIIDVEGEVK